MPVSAVLSGPQRKFCEGVAKGLSGTAAYVLAYPKSSRDAARSSAPDLLAKTSIQAEIDRLRAKAEEKAGSAVLTLVEKRQFLARVVRAQIAQLPDDSDLFDSVEETKFGRKYKLPSKISAIQADNELCGGGGMRLNLTLTANVVAEVPPTTIEAEWQESGPESFGDK